MNILRQRLLALVSGITLLFMALFLTSCGGGSKSAPASQFGRVVVSIKWPNLPAVSREIPEATKSIRITLKDGETLIAERLLVRPAEPPFVTEVIFSNIPFTIITARAEAFPNPD